VGDVLRARTQDDDDDEIGTFTDETRPTEDAVERLIVRAGTMVFGATGRLDNLACDGSDQVVDAAKHWIGMLTAMIIELSYAPEQVQSDRSAYAFYKEMWDDETTGFGSLIDAVAECKAGEIEPDVPGGDAATAVPDPSWSFPEDVGGMVGWATKW
jgi:hypothetical protein